MSLPGFDLVVRNARVATASDTFALLWLAVLPITSVLVIPQIQGTTPEIGRASCRERV